MRRFEFVFIDEKLFLDQNKEIFLEYSDLRIEKDNSSLYMIPIYE